jgi:glycosyltransferase involved in cell wall biosynthesis
MRILLIAPTPFFSDRGCHVRIYEVTKALSRRGHETLICTYGLGRDMPGVAIRRCYNFPWYRKQSAGPSVTKLLLLPVLVLRAARAVRSFRPDVVHCFLHEGALVGKALSLVYRKPALFFDMQGSLVDELCAHGFLRPRGALHGLLCRAERVICGFFPVVTPSTTLVEFLSALGVPRSRRINAADGVDTVRFCPRPFPEELAGVLGVDEKRPRLVYMGLLEEYQGVECMLLAVR